MTDARLERPLWRGRTNVDAYTIAWVEHAEDVVRRNWPEIAHSFNVTQGSYQGDGGDPNSGTTHRLGGVVDLSWCGHDNCLWALRIAGGFAWHRTPDQGNWPHHIHGGPRLHPFQDDALHRQELSYDADGNGLGGADDFRRPNPIPDPVWPWPPRDWFDMADEADLRRVVRDEVRSALAEAGDLVKVDHDNDPKTAKWSLTRVLRWLKR